jgi:hypothetical protein
MLVPSQWHQEASLSNFSEKVAFIWLVADLLRTRGDLYLWCDEGQGW